MRATMVLPDGSTQALTTINVRVSEYTVGEQGPAAMPGDLPPTSAYTYAAEFTVDEALAAGATEVRFEPPLINYLENFLDFPVGATVPSGFYDRTTGRWVPEPSGLVVQILREAGGRAVLDLNGDGQAADAAALAAVGIGDPELAQLAVLYEPGQTFWRVPIHHFSPGDFNWPMAPPPDATPPSGSPGPDPNGPDPNQPDRCEQNGSIIECRTQSLGEQIAIAGTPFRLDYRSHRVPGNVANRTIDIPLSGAELPASLQAIKLEVTVAGQRFSQTFPATPNQLFSYTWDGRDAFGRVLDGPQQISVRIGYVYPMTYSSASTFAGYGNQPFERNFGRTEFTFWQRWLDQIGGPPDPRPIGLGGWTVDIHHRYDPLNGLLMRGDGVQRRIGEETIQLIAGYEAQGRGLEPVQQEVRPTNITRGPDGRIYFADLGLQVGNSRIWRLERDGSLGLVAGGGYLRPDCTESVPADLCGIGGPATEVRLGTPEAIAVAPDGIIYVAMLLSDNKRGIFTIDRDGIIRVLVPPRRSLLLEGYEAAGDGGPADQARFYSIIDLAAGPDGSLFILDGTYWVVRRITPDGMIDRVAGTNNSYSCRGHIECGDGGPATEAHFSGPRGIAVSPAGELFVADRNYVRRIGSDGIFTTIAGKPPVSTICPEATCGDGGQAIEAQLQFASTVAIGPEGDLYIGDLFRIRRILADGTIVTVAGSGQSTHLVLDHGNGGLPLLARMQPETMVFGGDGGLYFADTFGYSLRRIGRSRLGAAADTIAFPSADGSAIFEFNPSGLHLRTRDALTGAVRYSFSYDDAGRLSGISDNAGNTTTIERNGSGDPTAIVAPFGRRTTLSLDPNGWLGTINGPGGSTYRLTHDAGGLLTGLTDPRGNQSSFSYDDLSFLVRDDQPGSAAWDLSRNTDAAGYDVTLRNAAGEQTVYRMEADPDGVQRNITTLPGGAHVVALRDPGGRRRISFPGGQTVSTQTLPDPRWGDQAPLIGSLTITTSGGLNYSLQRQREVSQTDRLDPLSMSLITDTLTLNGRSSTAVYNAATRTRTLLSAGGREARVTLDAQGRVVTRSFGGLAPLSYTYDAQGRVTAVSAGSGASARTTGYRYNTAGLLDQLTDPLGRTWQLSYDPAGRINQVTRPDGTTMTYNHDAAGNLATVTAPGGPLHSFGYGVDNQVVAYTAPALGANSAGLNYRYDAAGRPTQLDQNTAVLIEYNYDSAGRVSNLSTPGWNTALSYDAAGNLAGLDAPNAQLDIRYDGGLRSSVALAGTVAGRVDYAYTDNFDLSSLRVNGANPITYSYDNDRLPTQVGALALDRLASSGRISGTTLAQVSDSFSYNPFGEPNTYTARSGGTSLYNVTYTRDNLGRITQRVETIGGATATYVYRYDQIGRLSEVTRNGAVVEQYSYAANGNRTAASVAGVSSSASANNQDQLTAYGATSYSYSAVGTLASATTAGQTTSYSYDILGNLLNVNLAGGSVINYIVDGAGRRVGKQVNGALVQGWLYQDARNPIAELDAAGNIVSRFVYGSRSHVPDYLIRGGVTYRIISDERGSPRLVVNSADGSIVQRIDYDSFGAIVQDTNPGFQPFGFAGGLYDRDTGLLRFGARDYEPRTGRWTSKDPRGLTGGLNLYQYALGDPVNFIDPDGRTPLPIPLTTTPNTTMSAGGPGGLGDVIPEGFDEDIDTDVDYDPYPNLPGLPDWQDNTVPDFYIPGIGECPETGTSETAADRENQPNNLPEMTPLEMLLQALLGLGLIGAGTGTAGLAGAGATATATGGAAAPILIPALGF
ncbi:MAG: hypothetical protein HC822_16060 [Oscillochloris sp.]|nr:hypothetical protein [Oscillochloris sp.]